jgi:hypothetical protein
MTHAVRLMLLVSAVIGLGAGLLAGALVGVAQDWVAAAYHTEYHSPDGKVNSGYSPPTSDSRPVVVGFGAGLLAGGLAFLVLLRRLVGPDSARNNEGRREITSNQPPSGPA